MATEQPNPRRHHHEPHSTPPPLPGALTRITRRAGQRWQRPPGAPTRDTPSADICPVGQLSFWRIVNVPHGTWMAALEHWQLTGADTELRLGPGVLRGPAGHDPHFGTCQIQARLARGPLSPPVRMQLHIDRWSAAATAVELIPCQRVSPSTAYFRAGRALLDCLTCAVPAHPPAPHLADAAPGQSPAAGAEPRTAAPAGPTAGPAVMPARQEAR
jgi:hypothetical protein